MPPPAHPLAIWGLCRHPMLHFKHWMGHILPFPPQSNAPSLIHHCSLCLPMSFSKGSIPVGLWGFEPVTFPLRLQQSNVLNNCRKRLYWRVRHPWENKPVSPEAPPPLIFLVGLWPFTFETRTNTNRPMHHPPIQGFTLFGPNTRLAVV